MKTENNLLVLLETVILLQMLTENLEELEGTHYNRQRIKQLMKPLLNEIIPLAERDYNVVFGNGQEETLSIMNEYQKLIQFISLQKLPSKVVLSQVVEAWNKDHKTIETIVHEIINKK